MSDIVLDSCVVAKWFISEPDSSQAHQLFADASANGDRLVCLDLVFVEVTNIIWKYFRRGGCTAAEARANLADLLAVQVHIEQAKRLLPAALDIAMQYDRAVYDALFVALVIDLGARGVTADAPLVNVLSATYPQITLLQHWP